MPPQQHTNLNVFNRSSDAGNTTIETAKFGLRPLTFQDIWPHTGRFVSINQLAISHDCDRVSEPSHPFILNCKQQALQHWMSVAIQFLNRCILAKTSESKNILLFGYRVQEHLAIWTSCSIACRYPILKRQSLLGMVNATMRGFCPQVRIAY